MICNAGALRLAGIAVFATSARLHIREARTRRPAASEAIAQREPSAGRAGLESDADA
jgi:hypothetical protein